MDEMKDELAATGDGKNRAFIKFIARIFSILP
jgi:hypothetical protein